MLYAARMDTTRETVRRWTPLALLAVLVLCPTHADGRDDTPTWADDAIAILEGVDTVPAPGVPGTLIAFGRHAFPILVNDRGETLLAGARVGRGRMVAFGHSGLTDESGPDAERLQTNIARWLIGDRTKIRAFGISPENTDTLRAAGIDIDVLDAVPGGLAGVDLVFGTVHGLVREHGLGVEEIRRWLIEGGGLLAADTAWGYLQLKHAKTLDTLPCNRLALPEGLGWTNTLRDAPGGSAYPVPRRAGRVPPVSAHALLAAEMLCTPPGDTQSSTDESLAGAVASVSAAFASLPDAAEIKEMLRAQAGRDDLQAAYAGMAAQPLNPSDNPLACVLLDLDSSDWISADPKQIDAHPSAAAFPGPVPPNADRHAAAERFETRPHGWRSTGLYAPPGETVTLRFDTEAVGVGIEVQVGAWRDPQTFPQRVRMRRVLRRWPVDDTPVTVASPVGGPIYLDLPAGLDPDKIAVQVEGAVRAPHYRLGETDESEWRETTRHAPAPWAELETDKLVLTLPSAAVRGLEDPDALMRHWDRIHDAMRELEPRQASHWGDRQFRYVADRKLSWGYMYCPSDGPIVVPMSAAHEATDLAFITRPVGKPTMWGWYHEMGHAHQNRLWTFSGLGEVTVNIFTVYALDRVLGVDPDDDERARMGPAESWRRYDAFRESDRAFPGDPFTGLAMYALLWQQFGWEPFQRVFAEYRALPPDQQPADDQAKRDQWLIRMSNAVGRDLGPYFESWRVGVTPLARTKTAQLPAWLPQKPAAIPDP